MIVAVFSAKAQSSAKITEILETENVTWGQLAYLSAIQLSLADENDSEEKCISVLKENNIITKDAEASQTVVLKDIAQVCAKTWNVKGGIFYKIFHTPRYALRQLKNDGIIAVAEDPSKLSDGHELLNIINECIETYEGEKK